MGMAAGCRQPSPVILKSANRFGVDLWATLLMVYTWSFIRGTVRGGDCDIGRLPTAGLVSVANSYTIRTMLPEKFMNMPNISVVRSRGS
jgi:hypothetical protein